MAITKLWTVKSRLDTSLNYITNPEKTTIKPDIDAAQGVIQYVEDKDNTENCMLVRTYNCSRNNAFNTMMQTQDRWGKRNRKNGVVAYHLVQSFKDFETTPEIALKCGMELVERLFADKYEVVIATHVDQDHLHNHILINAVSFRDGKKYRRGFKDYFTDIRGVSDEICRNHRLSVVQPKGKGRHYAEWKALSTGKPTIRGQMRQELDEIIKSSYTMRDFWSNLKQRGYTVHRNGNTIKHISIIPPYGKRPIRLENLGDEYTIEAIGQRMIANRNGIHMASPSELPHKQYKIRGNLKQVKRKKLKGFQALYFHYLYLFKKIRSKQTPQRVSFFMREELAKLERYQKQFKFIVTHNIETGDDLCAIQSNLETQITALIVQRKALYAERTDENRDEIKAKAAQINKELTTCRCNVHLCKAILQDANRITEKKRQAAILQKQADKEMMLNEHKRRSR